MWIGGSGDGGLHERTPYWLNGIVPLAFLLRNANHTPVTQHAGIWKVPSTDSAVFRNASLTSDAEVDCGMHLSAVVTPLMKTVVGSNNNEGAATMPVRAADRSLRSSATSPTSSSTRRTTAGSALATTRKGMRRGDVRTSCWRWLNMRRLCLTV